MKRDPLLPIAPARVKALLLPLGKIREDRFSAFTDRLQVEDVVHLRDISADGRPNRNMFSPLANPDGVLVYDLTGHLPPPSHLALSPFDLYREPLVIIALADGLELGDATYSKRQSASNSAATMVEKNLRALEQELEGVRDDHPQALVHRVIVFDFMVSPEQESPIPDGIICVPPQAECKRTTLKTIICDISSHLLAEMTTMAKSLEAMPTIEPPGMHLTETYSGHAGGGAGAELNGTGSRRSSHNILPHHLSRSSSATGAELGQARMSTPPGMIPRPATTSTNALPGRPSTPNKSGQVTGAEGSDHVQSVPGSRQSSPAPAERFREGSRDRVAVQGFGSGGTNDRWRQRGKGRVSVVIGSMYLQAGRWSNSLKELTGAATVTRSLNDHVWHGKALELILLNLLLLGWSDLEFQIPAVCLLAQERPRSLSITKTDTDPPDPTQPLHLRRLQSLIPDMLDKIVGLYSKVSTESLPPFPLAESVVRFCKILSALHICDGKLNKRALDMIVRGSGPEIQLTTSPRLTISPSRQHIVNFLFRAFPASTAESLDTADRIAILSSIATVLGPLGYHRKKAIVLRELVSVLIAGLVKARTRGAAEAGVHPAAGLVAMTPGSDQESASIALDLGAWDVERGLDALLDLLCRSYGVIGSPRHPRQGAGREQEVDDSDGAIVDRLLAEFALRFCGFTNIKLNIIRACINFSEALPDFQGVLRFSGELLRTAGSGVAPGPLHEDAAPMILRDEQVRLANNIARTATLVQRLGKGHLAAEYWDEFLVRSITLEPLPKAQAPILHTRGTLKEVTATRASRDTGPFIYDPLLKTSDEVSVQTLVAGEVAVFRLTLQNTYDVELNIERIRLCTEGVGFDAFIESAILGPYRTQSMRLRGRPSEAGSLKITGAIVMFQGCRERRFPIFANPWCPMPPLKIKSKGLAAGADNYDDFDAPMRASLEPKILSLSVISEQPMVLVSSCTLPQHAIMILEGETQVFSVTFRNASVPVDFMLFSFRDSTQAPLQEALNRRDATATEMYEYELVLMKKQALRVISSGTSQSMSPGGEATFDFEILGRPGLTDATIQLDYAFLGASGDAGGSDFHTRQTSLDVMVTVNTSVELMRVDALPTPTCLPQSLWAGMGGNGEVNAEDYCFFMMDFRNAWPNPMTVLVESSNGLAVEQDILPGKINRVVVLIKRSFLDHPHAAIPSLNPHRKRQFVVSNSQISPELERANREAFWYRERILEGLKATWRTASVPKHQGVIDLRSIRLSSRMMEAIKIDDVGIEVTVREAVASGDGAANLVPVDQFMQIQVHITNRTSKTIRPLVRLVPALRHRPANVALDFARKFAWNGTLQQMLPPIEAKSSADMAIGAAPLCRGEFELTASVEEIRVPQTAGGVATAAEQRTRFNTQTMLDAALGREERRMWHSRRPYVLTVQDDR